MAKHRRVKFEFDERSLVECPLPDQSQAFGESVYERLDHLERLCDTISDEVNWVRARDQIKAIRAWCKTRAGK